MSSLLRWERQQKDFLRTIFNSYISRSFFLLLLLFFCCCFFFHLELKRQIRSYTPVVRSKTVPDSRPKWAKSIPVFWLRRRKNPTLRGGISLYGLYKGVPPPPPPRLTNPTLFVTSFLNQSCLIIRPSWLWDNTTPVTWSTDLHFKCPFTTDPEVTKQSRSETTVKNIIRVITEV